MSAVKGGNSVSAWKIHIAKHLGKSVARKHVGLMADITAVDSGIKPGYLYDVGAPDAARLTNLLVDLKSAGLISTCCNVVQVGMDCIIVNVDSVKAMHVSVDGLKERLVDVSPGRDSPGLYEGSSACKQLVKTLNDIQDNLDGGRICTYSVDEAECNVSSLFGLLLGYPVLYWYDNATDHHGNCLSMETLTCVKLLVRFICEKCEKLTFVQGCDVKHGLYSISFPSCLSYCLKAVVDGWFVAVQDRVRQSEAFSEPELVEENAEFETLNL